VSYTTATVQDVAPEADGRLHLNIAYTGNAGEPRIILPLYVNQSTAPGADDLRAQAMVQLALLNTNRSAMSGLSSGMILDTTTPIPAPATPRSQRFYMAASLPFTPGATPQDVFTITGSASKTITVIRAGITTVQTTAGLNTWHLLMRSTANTAGTSAAVAAVPTDSTFTPATATVLQYTANPTAGTLVGRVWSGRVDSPVVSTAGVGEIEKSVVFAGLNITPVTLNGISQVLAWNFNGVALPVGLSITALFWWMEY
jgi:hypothetical protein